MLGRFDMVRVVIPDGALSPIQPGPLQLPVGMTVDGELIAIGENTDYLHCIVSGTGAYVGVFKSPLRDHMYQSLLRLNAETAEA